MGRHRPSAALARYRRCLARFLNSSMNKSRICSLGMCWQSVGLATTVSPASVRTTEAPALATCSSLCILVGPQSLNATTVALRSLHRRGSSASSSLVSGVASGESFSPCELRSREYLIPASFQALPRQSARSARIKVGSSTGVCRALSWAGLEPVTSECDVPRRSGGWHRVLRGRFWAA